MRSNTILSTLFASAFGLAILVGCSGKASLNAGVNQPPNPPPVAADQDNDGIPDDQDKCPTESGTPEKEGCPDPGSPDPDGDGIEGDADKCPNKAETKNKYQDADGCPDETPDVYLSDDHFIVHKEHIKFAKGSSKLAAESDELIGKIAKIINDNPTIEKVEVAGHTDTDGDDKMNLKLSKDRSKSVMAALAKHGVDAGKLVSTGYGEFCPTQEGDTEEAHHANRRVDLIVLKQGGKALTPNWDGCKNATDHGLSAPSL